MNHRFGPLLLSVSAALFWGGPARAEDYDIKYHVTPDGSSMGNKEASKIKSGNSFAPLVGYDPTFGVILGAAYFRGNIEPPITNGSIVVFGTFHKNFAADLKYRVWAWDGWYFGIELGASNFYDSYFGEGDKTDPKQQVKIQSDKYCVNPTLGFHLSESITLELISELRYRYETGVNGDASQRLFGTDYTPIFGAALSFDQRDSEVDTKYGTYVQARTDFGPARLSTRKGAADFTRFFAEARQFVSLGGFLVLGAQLQGAASVGGDAGYQYRYNLGGANDLRGYQANRLRGRHFYEAQSELRLSIVKWLGVVGFIGAGDTADQKFSDFTSPKVTKGGGLRIGVPPDYVAKLRIDYGVAPDEKNIYVNFNEAF